MSEQERNPTDSPRARYSLILTEREVRELHRIVAASTWVTSPDVRAGIFRKIDWLVREHVR